MNKPNAITRQEQQVVAVAEQAAAQGPDYTQRILAGMRATGLAHLVPLYLTAVVQVAAESAGTSLEALIRRERLAGAR